MEGSLFYKCFFGSILSPLSASLFNLDPYHNHFFVTKKHEKMNKEKQ